MAANTKKLDTLKAEVDARKQEVATAQAHLDEAEAAFYAFQRECNRTRKPSPAQLALLKRLAAGNTVRENRYRFGTYYIATENGNEPVRWSVLFGLVEREAVSDIDERKVYRITEHGRSFLQPST